MLHTRFQLDIHKGAVVIIVKHDTAIILDNKRLWVVMNIININIAERPVLETPSTNSSNKVARFAL